MNTYLACLNSPMDIVRMAPLAHALKARGQAVHVLHTGFVDEAVNGLCEFLGLSPDTQVSLLRKNPRLPQLMAELLTRLDTHLQHIAPDVVLVQGDSTCALASALTASCQDIPVAHLLSDRSTGQDDRFPEDMNHGLIQRIARWHFLSTPEARQKLLRDGIDASRIHTVGNTLIDAAQLARQCMERACLKDLLPPDVLRFMRLHDHDQLLLVATQHRQNRGRPMQRIAAAIGGLLQLHPQLTVVWPLPSNPQLRADVYLGLACVPAEVHQRLCLTETLPYPAEITLLEACSFILTDSDHLQQQASALQKPVLILREHCERQELVEAGGAMVAGNMAQPIVELAGELLRDPLLLTSMRLPASPFGDGQAAQRMADILSGETESRSVCERMAA